MKAPIALQSETPYYQFDNQIKFGINRKQFTTHVALNMIHINQNIREQYANGNEQYEINLKIKTSTSCQHSESTGTKF